MASSFGGSVKLTGETEYQKALRGISDNLKVMSSEMKVVTSQYDKNDSSSQNLAQQSEVLNKKLDEQKNKVNVLKEALEQARTETGENSTTTKKWQTQLNNAQAEVNKTTNEIKNLGKEEDNTSEKTSRLGDIIKGQLISEAIVGGVKALAGAMKQVGAALFDMGKQAIESYAEYEQLIGGVDTLFKESSSKVQEYANNSFKTSGLSANQYMETVTSFSASLLQSLGGDTEKAAEVGDMAITDMSDNANKMGTSMESIQNAYQGFAKGQYQLLDNLKLGYGGTKGEMERLLADASKLSGQKYDISNLNDVYQAIHVVQTELGITGTTAKEASTTISGSVSSMKSAWQNLLTGIADDNANFSDLVGNFVDSIIGEDGEGGVLNNILPRIEVALNGIIELILQLSDTLLPKILEMGVKLIQNLITGISSNLPSLMSSIISTVNMIVKTIIDMLPQLLQMGITIIIELTKGIAESLPTLIPAIVDAVLLMVETLIDNIDLIIDAGVELIIGLAEGLIIALPRIIEKIPVIIDKLVKALTNPEMMVKLVGAALKLMVELAKGLIKAIPQLIKSIPQIITSLVNGLKAGLSKIKNVGKDLITGLWNGIKEKWDSLKNKVSDFGKGVVDKFKNVFGIKSPSKVFKEQIGTNLALGIGEGFSDTMGNVAKDMSSAIPTEFDTSVNMTSGSSIFSYESMVGAFKQALSEMKVELDDKVAGKFVEDTLERVVFS